jgi:predicted regulator of Ras-like GTPase activity (Roadblock/LC7/MglB family)
MHNSKLDIILGTFPLVEVAIHLSMEGLPLDWRCRTNTPVEEITSIAAGLFSIGFELGMVSGGSGAQLSIDTDHGAMLVRSLPDSTLLLLMSGRGCSQQDVEIKLGEMFTDNNTK